jgi:hypothetical protein
LTFGNSQELLRRRDRLEQKQNRALKLFAGGWITQNGAK